MIDFARATLHLQIQMFWEDMAMKGTFLVNHKVYNLNMQTNV
uniref:Uncharacterized protein n=1 Tax=Physcomitrium patens TaxID=3218 RepID=A0A7I4BFZ0_PHYPA